MATAFREETIPFEQQFMDTPLTEAQKRIRETAPAPTDVNTPQQKATPIEPVQKVAPALPSIPPVAPAAAPPPAVASWAPQHAGSIQSNLAQAGPVGMSTAVDQARSLIAGANVNPFQTVAGPNFSDPRTMIQGANIGNFQGVAGPDFAPATQDLDRAAGTLEGATVGGLETIGAGSYANSPEAVNARAIASQILARLNSAPNRTEIAGQKLDIFNDRSGRVLEENLQATGRANAALGRLGSGMVRDDLRKAVTDIDRERSLLSRELAAETAGLEFSDELGRLNAGLAAGGQFRSEDLADAGMNLNLRNEARGERGVHAARESEQAQLALARSEAQRLIGGQRGDLASRTHSAAVGERDAEAGHNRAGAALSLDKAGMLGDLTSREHAASVYERDAGVSHDFGRANLDLNKGSGLLGVANTEHQVGFNNAALALDRANLYRGLDQDSRRVFETDRSFGRGVYEDDRNFGRGTFESDRNFGRGVYESDRNYGLDYVDTLMGFAPQTGSGSSGMTQEQIEQLLYTYGANRPQGANQPTTVQDDPYGRYA